MVKKSTLEKLATDLRLDSDTRSLVLFVAVQGSGKQPIHQDRIHHLLRRSDPRFVRRCVGLAVETGWLSVEKGGGGNPNSYEFLGESDHASHAQSEDESDHASHAQSEDGQTVPDAHTLKGSDHASRAHSGKEGRSDHASHAQSEPDHASHAQSEVPDHASHAQSGGARSSSRTENVDTPLVSPQTKNDLDVWVGLTLEEDEWAGCRSALADYMRERVPTSRQKGYLMSIQTWFEGAPSAPKNFHRIEPEQQKLLLASCLNELLQESAVDERKYGSARGREGQVYTLRAKMEFNLSRYFRERAKPGSGKAAVDQSVARDPYGRELKGFGDEPIGADQ